MEQSVKEIEAKSVNEDNKKTNESKYFDFNKFSSNQDKIYLDKYDEKSSEDYNQKLIEYLQQEINCKSIHLSRKNLQTEHYEIIADFIGKSKSLQSIDLRSNEIGDVGAKYLGEGIGKSKSLRSIDLEFNKIGSEGAKYLGEGISKSQSLQSINLGSNKIGAEGAKYLGEGIAKSQSLQSIGLQYNKIGSEGAKYLGEGIAKSQSLQSIELKKNYIGAEGAKYLGEGIGKSQSLQSIDLHWNNIGDAGAKYLGEGIGKSQSLQSIDLWDNGIGSEGAKYLGEGIAKSQSLQSIDLSWNKIGSEGAKYLGECIGKSQSLQSIYLPYNKIGAEGAKYLGEGIGKSQSLQSIDLHWNNIGDAGAKYLGEGIGKSQSLQSIDLEGNNIGDEVEKYIIEAASSSKALLYIDIGGIYIDDKEEDKIYQQTSLNTERVLSFIADCLVKVFIKKQAISDEMQQKFISFYNYHYINLFKVTLTANSYIRELGIDYSSLLKDRYFSVSFKDALNCYLHRYNTSIKKLESIAGGKLEEKLSDVSIINQQKQKNLENLEKLRTLIKEGNLRISGKKQSAVMLLGNTGAGKSTLANLLSGNKLLAKVDEDTGDMQIRLTSESASTIKIGHEMLSETKIPNKCIVRDKAGEIVVWDSPGFNDTDMVQEVANSFYINKLFRQHKQLKLILVVPESDITGNRGKNFIDTLEQFISSYGNITELLKCLRLVVSQSPPQKRVRHLQQSIKKILEQRKDLSKELQEVLSSLSESLLLFKQPKQEGIISGYEGLIDSILELDNSNSIDKLESQRLGIKITSKAQQFCKTALLHSYLDFTELFYKFVGINNSANRGFLTSKENVFVEIHPKLKSMLPGRLEISYYEVLPRDTEVFLEIEQLSEILSCFAVIDDLVDVDIEKLLLVIREILSCYQRYQSLTEVQSSIYEFSYALQQQVDYCQILAKVGGLESPFRVSEILEQLKSCQESIRSQYKRSILDIKLPLPLYIAGAEYLIDTQIVWYQLAIKYLQSYANKPICIAKLAKSYRYIGECYLYKQEKQSNQEAEQTHNRHAYYKLARMSLIKSLSYNAEPRELYNLVGKCYQATGDYQIAIKFYQVSKNFIELKRCYQELLKTKESALLYEQMGDSWYSLNLLSGANKHYAKAISLEKLPSKLKELQIKQAKCLGAESRQQLSEQIVEKVNNNILFDYEAINIKEFVEDDKLTVLSKSNNKLIKQNDFKNL